MASDVDVSQCLKGNWAITRAICSALPAWFRFAQCFRRYKDQKDTVHLVNAGKYSSTLLVVIFSFFNAYFYDPNVSYPKFISSRYQAPKVISFDISSLLISPAGS